MILFRPRRHRAWARAVAAGAVLACLGSVVPATASGPEPSNYIVLFRAEPLAGRDLESQEAVEYRGHLDAIEARVLRTAGLSGAALGYRYRTALAGFSARLTAPEAERLRQLSDVASVTPDRIRVFRHRRPERVTAEARTPPVPGGAQAGAAPPIGPARAAAPVADTDLRGQPAEFLGLPEGLWAELGGPDHAGEDVVVGIIDGGIFPEHPSFADQPMAPDGSRNYIGPAYGPPPATWRGICQEGENFPVTTCNNKLIGARWFVDGRGATNVAEEDFLSPRDVDGHGTGMAATAAGNYGVDPSYQGNDLGLGVISGIAPRARIAHYKTLWAIPAFDGAGYDTDSDTAAAVDAAVSDGVDVISMSIGGAVGETLPFTDQSTIGGATAARAAGGVRRRCPGRGCGGERRPRRGDGGRTRPSAMGDLSRRLGPVDHVHRHRHRLGWAGRTDHHGLGRLAQPGAPGRAPDRRRGRRRSGRHPHRRLSV